MQNKFIKRNIDSELTNRILERFNNKEFNLTKKLEIDGFPTVDNKTVIDLKNLDTLQFSEDQFSKLFNNYEINKQLFEKCKNNNFCLDRPILEEIGINLYPYFSYGVLNGGSATSYVDKKNNKKFNIELFNELSDTFNKLSLNYKNRPKGITPAFINPNGTAGPSFMELKMRSLLLKARKFKEVTNKSTENLFPIFQMTSTTNNDEISNYFKKLDNSIFLKDLILETGIKINSVKTGIQPLIAAFTTDSVKKDIFLDKNGNPLGLPGGHGHCFYTLKNIFMDLHKKGIKFISIGNVDNIGYTLDPVALAILAITNKQATFDFSFKTSFDVKGGILIKEKCGKINCADLGVAVSKESVNDAEKKSTPILFNCATGIFNLEYLIKNLDYLINNLPTRFTNQNKDIGEYCQAEQVTWEVISLLDDFLILAVDKYDRFLASKLLIENLATSGLAKNISDSTLKECASALNNGLKNKLHKSFNLTLVDNEWRNND